MLIDPTQRRLINRLALLTAFMGILAGISIALAALAAGSLWARHTGATFLPLRVEQILQSSFPLVLGATLTASIQVGRLRGQLGLATPSSNSNLVLSDVSTFIGLCMAGLGGLSLLDTLLDYIFPTGTYLIFMLVMLPGCLLVAWYSYRRRNRRAAHP